MYWFVVQYVFRLHGGGSVQKGVAKSTKSVIRRHIDE